jgi:hypothetical protein
MKRIEQLLEALRPSRDALLGHRLYSTVESVEDIRVFMSHHIFAVWDFMSLLKSLQHHLTCTSIPWLPSPYPMSRRLINEIVLGEESDTDAEGKACSHFEMYVDAMKEIGADCKPIEDFIGCLSAKKSIESAMEYARVPETARTFTSATLRIATQADPHIVAGVFTFGREDLIPEMFSRIVPAISTANDLETKGLRYYLERHIELDGEQHGPMALAMIDELCGDDWEKWRQCEEASQEALLRRIELWDGVCASIESSDSKQPNIVV